MASDKYTKNINGKRNQLGKERSYLNGYHSYMIDFDHWMNAQDDRIYNEKDYKDHEKYIKAILDKPQFQFEIEDD